MIDGLKPYPAYRDSGVPWLGEVPEHWDCERLRSVVWMKVSSVDKHQDEGELPVRLCNYVDVYKHDQIDQHIKFMSASATSDEIKQFRIMNDDVLITKDSESWNDIGVPALVKEQAEDLVCGYHLAILRPDRARIRGGYLLRAIQSRPISYQFHVEANGVTRYGLSHEAIKSVRLPIPPDSEQIAIVRYLDYMDRRIQRYIRAKQKLIKLLEEQKQAIIHKAVTGQIDVRTGKPYPAYKPSGVEWLGDVPEHYERYRLKNLLRSVDCRSVTGAETLLSLRRDHGIVVYSDHFSRPSQSMALIGYKLVEVDQIVVNRLQANNGLIFRSGIKGLISPDYSVFATNPVCETEFLARLLRSSTYRSQFRRVATGLGTGTSGFLRLYDDKLLETAVFLPSKEEQRSLLDSIGEICDEIEGALAAQKLRLSLLLEYRIRLIADVVTGKLDAREAAANLPAELEEELTDYQEQEDETDEDLGDEQQDEDDE